MGETGYYYFGEFGYFNLEVLGGLQALFQIHPSLRLKIATYPSYAQLLEHLFGDRVRCTSPDWPYDERRRDCHTYDCRQFHRSLFWQGFNQNLVSLFDELKHRGRVHLARMFYLDAPFSMPQTDRHTQYISIFPRGRHYYASKNLDARQWEVVLQAFSISLPPVVVHGVKAEMTPIPRAEKFIHPKGILEQVFYLNRSRFCVSPDSGFVQFALNCGCDVFVIGGTIQYHEFAGFNPFGKRLVIASKEPQEYLPALREFAEMRHNTIRLPQHQPKRFPMACLIVHRHVQIAARDAHVGVASGVADLGQRSSAGQGMADEVCRPWWIVSVSSRAAPRTLHAVRNRLRSVWRENVLTTRPGINDARNGSSYSAPARSRSAFHAARSSSVPASHQSGTIRGRPPFDAPLRMRMCGRASSVRTSPTRSLAISLARRPQQQARRKSARFSRVFFDRGACA